MGFTSKGRVRRREEKGRGRERKNRGGMGGRMGQDRRRGRERCEGKMEGR